MRICSLLPSATEIVFGLGAGEYLAGVTHECDYPEQATRIAKLTRSHIPPGISSEQIDSRVNASLKAAGSLYELDLALLEALQPDLILTQRLCDVCAVPFDSVQRAAESLRSRPRVLNLEPHSLGDILENIAAVGEAIGAVSAAQRLVRSLQLRIEAIRSHTQSIAYRPRVVCMEWVNPPFCGGHWMEELVEIAGGRDGLANRHRPSYRIPWRRVLEFSPEIIILTCCGFSLERCAEEGEVLATFEGVHELPAAQAGRIFATDGSAYFSRPGPRIVESLEILAHLIHPELFAAPSVSKAFSRLNLPRD